MRVVGWREHDCRRVVDRGATGFLRHVHDERFIGHHGDDEGVFAHHGGGIGGFSVTQALGASQRVFELTANPFKPVKGSGLDRYYSEKNHTTDMAFTSQDAFKGEVQLNNVTFAYPQEPQHIVLHGVSGC